MKELVEIDPREYFKFSHVNNLDSPDPAAPAQELDSEDFPALELDSELTNLNDQAELIAQSPDPEPQVELTNLDDQGEVTSQPPDPESQEEDIPEPQVKLTDLNDQGEVVSQPSDPEPENKLTNHDPPLDEDIVPQLDAERATAMIDMMTGTDIQHMMGGQQLADALQTNTHQGTYKLLNTGYTASDTGYAFAGLS